MSLDHMRAAGKLAAQTLDFITPYVKAGVSTLRLNDLCHDFIMVNDAIPAPLNYKGFPKSICTSVNHVVCHGIPDDKKILHDGDILNIDVTVILNGWYGDTSRMFTIGEPSVKTSKLIDITEKALYKGIEQIRDGAHVGDIGEAIQKFAESNGYSVVKEYCGHGIGQFFHGAPQITHFGKRGEGAILKEGMFITVEPMINIGKPETKLLSDGWTVVTKDKSLSAQMEHTIAVLKDGYEILTVSN